MRLRLEVFRPDPPASPAAGPATVVTDSAALEEARLAAYEQGYAAGWDDAVAAAETDRSRVSADLAAHLQDLGFTYHEARAHVLAALEPLLAAMTERILPALAREALPTLVVETLRPLARDAALVPVHLVVHPAARGAVEQALLTEAALPVVLGEDAALAETAARLWLGDNGRTIDLDAAVAAIARAAADFFQLARSPAAAPPDAPVPQEPRHG